MKKYELTNECREISIDGINLRRNTDVIKVYRIKACVDFYITNRYNEPVLIKKGDIGGWVQSEDNLSQFGNCWIGVNSFVLESAKVEQNALVLGASFVLGNALVSENARVDYNSIVDGHAVVYGNSIVYGFVRDGARVCGNSRIAEMAVIAEDAYLESADVGFDTYISGYTNIYASVIRDNCFLTGNSYVANSIIERKNSINDSAVLKSRTGKCTRLEKSNIMNSTLEDNSLFSARKLKNKVFSTKIAIV